MTTTPDPIAAIERIEKAMKHATTGVWDVWEEQTPTKAEAVAEMAYQVENSEPFAEAVYLLNANGKCPATTGCGPTSAANAAYIAACNPFAMREVLDELYALRETALQLEAMQREMAAILDAEALSGIRALVAGWNGEHLPENERFGRHHDQLGVKLPTTCGAIYALDEAMIRARTLIQGDKP